MIANKKGLIFIAHGSRNVKSNEQIASLTSEITKIVAQKYTMISHAFLEFAEPSISDAIHLQVANDIHEIIIFPYFLTNGNHVMVDIPEIIHNFTLSHPHIKFSFLPVFGSYSGMASLIAALL